jgi:hypothetical protein
VTHRGKPLVRVLPAGANQRPLWFIPPHPHAA